MFEMTRRDPWGVGNLRELIESISNDQLMRGTMMSWSEDGTLPLDIYEDNGEFVVIASLPGFRKDDVDVQIHDGVLTIRARKEREQETKSAKAYRRERRVGSLSRRVALPGPVTAENVKAELKDGELQIRVPVAESAKPKQITIS